ncbi:MAG: hypothetical protein CMB99_02115 [Flavobacteriaceae bacterium]|nr:hypothetical protein [Flavobacteriaceae bacterium]|tara:strand:+ start:7955 stop:8677 length:723 start_codon:yes stop_codon:yes gene_type:complete
MKKHLIILIVLIGFVSCNKTSPEGVWITIKDKQMTSKNGYTKGITSLVVDFDKLETQFLYTHQDSTLKFTINSKSNQILPDGDSIYINYKLYNDDSLEVYIERQNLTKVLVPLNLNSELDLSKEQIIQILTKQQSYSINDTLSIEFLNNYFENDYFTKGIKDKRILTSHFPKREFSGYWYIGQKNKNYFLVIDPEPYTTKEYIFQIININEKKIVLKDIATEGLLIKIDELKPVYNNGYN